MNTRFYNAKILVLDAENHFSIAEDELHVTGDTITYIGPGRKADPDAAETPVFDREIDARGNLLIPGFKNAHTHTPMTFLRSYADDLPLHEWLERQVFPNEAKLAGDDVYWLNILGIMEYLTSGITSNFDMYIQQKNSIAATVDTGFRTVLTSGLNNFVDSPEILEEMYNYVNELSDRTSYLLGFHAEYTTGGPLLEAVAKLAEKYHSPVWTHNAETKSEVEGCKERWGITPTQLMERLGKKIFTVHSVYTVDIFVKNINLCAAVQCRLKCFTVSGTSFKLKVYLNSCLFCISVNCFLNHLSLWLCSFPH